MRYNDAVQPLETGGMLETRQFTIAATGKAFRNLMDGLYSRKIEAFCREILTNAFDSHCEAGTPDRLFEVWVPTIFDKRLKVRDFGVGMDHEQVMSRYSTLFDSTKDHSDEFVGMLGLGSKSPFAYTDGFSLRCWDGAECRTYSAYLGPGGVPQISLAGRQPSTEPRGVEVGIPVSRADFEEVQEALARVCLGFPNPPKLPESVLKRMQFDVTAAGDGWAVGRSDALESGVFARMGCVLYPVPTSEVARVIDGWSDEKDSASIVVDFSLGELEITPSREALSLTDRTREGLRKRLEEFQKGVAEEFGHLFDHCGTDWETAMEYDKLLSGKIPQQLIRTLPQRSIHHRIRSILSELLYKTSRSPKSWRWVMVERAHRYYSGARQCKHGDMEYSATHETDSYRHRNVQFPKKDKELVFVVDAETSNAKIAAWLYKNDVSSALVLRRGSQLKTEIYEHRDPTDKRGPDGKWTRRPLWSKPYGDLTEDDLLKMEIVGQLGNPPFRKASSFAKAPPLKRPPVEREDGLVLNPVTGAFEPVDKKQLKALLSTHRFMFYSKQRKCVLTPRGDVPAEQWPSLIPMDGSLSELVKKVKLVTGSNPKLALVRVTPKVEYGDVRFYPLSDPLEEIILRNSPPSFWDEVIPDVLWKHLPSDIVPHPKILSYMEVSENPNLRRLARLVRECEGQEEIRDSNELYYRRKRGDMMMSLVHSNQAVLRRFLDEARLRDYRVPIFGENIWTKTEWLSPRWRQFLRKMNAFLQSKDGEEARIYYEAMEAAELEVQRKGGFKCRR